MFDTILACLLASHRADPSAWVQDDPNEDSEACEASVQRGIDWRVSTPPRNSPEMLRRLRAELASIVTDTDHARFMTARNAARAQLQHGEHE